jgi:hypothetical protein
MAFAQSLPPELERWKTEIEDGGRVNVRVVRVDWQAATNAFSLPAGTPEAELFARYLRDPEFLAAFQRTHALTASERVGDRYSFFIFLNRKHLEQWGPFEEALLAHELFHAWFIGQRYPVPTAQPGKAGCLSIATLDLVQHVVMRDELKRRGIDHAKYQRRKREIAVEEGARWPGPRTSDPCLRVSAVSEWVDMQLELGPDADYNSTIRRLFPGVEEIGREIAAYLTARDLRDRDTHREALSFVFYRLRQFWETGK